jgi:hypothetical protein
MKQDTKQYVIARGLLYRGPHESCFVG